MASASGWEKDAYRMPMPTAALSNRTIHKLMPIIHDHRYNPRNKLPKGTCMPFGTNPGSFSTFISIIELYYIRIIILYIELKIPMDADAPSGIVLKYPVRVFGQLWVITPTCLLLGLPCVHSITNTCCSKHASNYPGINCL